MTSSKDVYNYLLAIPTHSPGPQRIAFARVSVGVFENALQSKKLDQKLALKVAKPPIRNILEDVLKGRIQSALNIHWEP